MRAAKEGDYTLWEPGGEEHHEAEFLEMRFRFGQEAARVKLWEQPVEQPARLGSPRYQAVTKLTNGAEIGVGLSEARRN